MYLSLPPSPPPPSLPPLSRSIGSSVVCEMYSKGLFSFVQFNDVNIAILLILLALLIT